MIDSRRPMSWGVWPLWVAAGAAGGALGAAAFWGGGRLSDTTGDKLFLPFVIHPLSVLVVVALPGFLQWLILRRRFPRAGWWILASGVGSLAGFLFVMWALGLADTEQGGLAFVRVAVPALLLVGGAVAGALQWLAALPWFPLGRWAAGAGWWVLASSISWLGATWLFMSLTRAGDARPAGLYFVLGGAASGFVSGAITGLALVWLSRDTGRSASLHPIR